MYDLPQAGILAHDCTWDCLKQHRLYQSNLVHGLWNHEWRPIQFTLVMDDFLGKYVGKEHAKHLAAVLSECYKVMED